MGSQGKYFVNMKPVMEKLEKLIQDEPLVLETALRETAKKVKNRAKELVPVKTGALRKGIRYSVAPSRNVAMVYASAKSGGAGHEYAVIVHENMEANHKRGEPKFIEKPTQELAGSDEMLAELRKAIIERFKTQYGYTPNISADPDADN